MVGLNLGEVLRMNNQNDPVRFIFSGLTDREKKVIACRYGIGGANAMTLEEVGQMFDVTRERIRQIEFKALSKMRNRARLAGLEITDLI
jgi:RNA polymerase primary sigma factor